MSQTINFKYTITIYTKDGDSFRMGAPTWAAAVKTKREEERSPLVKKQWQDLDGDILYIEDTSVGMLTFNIEEHYSGGNVLAVNITPEMWEEIKSYVDSRFEEMDK